MKLYKYIVLILKSISIIVLASVAQAVKYKNSATVFMYHKFGFLYPSVSVTIEQFESHIMNL